MKRIFLLAICLFLAAGNAHADADADDNPNKRLVREWTCTDILRKRVVLKARSYTDPIGNLTGGIIANGIEKETKYRHYGLVHTWKFNFDENGNPRGTFEIKGSTIGDYNHHGKDGLVASNLTLLCR